MFDGEVKIILENKNNRNMINKIYYNGVSKVSPTMYLDDENIPCYFLIHIGGGYLEGEKCKNYIELKDNTRAIITTQTPTVIYKCEKETACKQYTKIRLGNRSVLEYLMDNTILFKNAIYNQYTDIYIDKDSTFIYTDGITAGWSPDGKKFKYKSIHLVTKVFVNNEIVLLDNLILKPKEQELDEIGFFEGYTNYGTAIIIDKRIDDKVIEILRKYINNLNLDINFGISRLEVNGFVLRVLGNMTQDIHKAVYLCISFVRNKLFNSNEICLRKY